MTRDKVRWALIVGLAAFVVFIPSLRNGYTLDDVAAVQQDVRLRTLGGVSDILSQPYLWDVPPARSPYRPLTSLTYLVDWQLGHGHPFVFHLFNVLAHVACTLMLFFVLMRMGADSIRAGVATLLFAVHPVHVEAVANIVGRADILMTFFCLLGVAVYLAQGLPRWIRYAGVCVVYALALGAKENGYVLPLLIVLVEGVRRWGEAGVTPRDHVLRMIKTWPLQCALAGVLAAYVALRGSVLGSVVHLDVAAYIAALPTQLRITTAVANLTEVARLLVFPNDLSWHYGPAVLNPAGFADLRFWVGVVTCLLLASITVWALRRADSGHWYLLCVGWVVATFVLLSNLMIPMPMWLAERTLYLPSVGVAFGCVAVLTSLSKGGVAPTHRGVLMIIGLLTLLGGARSWQYSKTWESNDTLFTDLVERHPESFRAPWWTGQRLVDAGDLERGLQWLERAVEANPNGVMVRLDYTRALIMAGRSVEAERLLTPIPRGLHPSVSVFLAQSLVFQERLDEARAVVVEGLRHFPDEERLRQQLSVLDLRE